VIREGHSKMNLNEDVLCEIFLRTNPEFVCQVAACVCTEWDQAAKSTVVWDRFGLQGYSVPLVADAIAAAETDSVSWRLAMIRACTLVHAGGSCVWFTERRSGSCSVRSSKFAWDPVWTPARDSAGLFSIEDDGKTLRRINQPGYITTKRTEQTMPKDRLTVVSIQAVRYKPAPGTKRVYGPDPDPTDPLSDTGVHDWNMHIGFSPVRALYVRLDQCISDIIVGYLSRSVHETRQAMTLAG
jgi:hypothetical protein